MIIMIVLIITAIGFLGFLLNEKPKILPAATSTVELERSQYATKCQNAS
jgi:hypothetical protein